MEIFIKCLSYKHYPFKIFKKMANTTIVLTAIVCTYWETSTSYQFWLWPSPGFTPPHFPLESIPRAPRMRI